MENDRCSVNNDDGSKCIATATWEGKCIKHHWRDLEKEREENRNDKENISCDCVGINT